MTTFVNKSSISDVSTNASAKVWIQFIHNALLANWVQTADTGQLDPYTTTWTPAATDAGYCIYKMADAMQAAFPLYLRVDYGGASASRPQIKVAVGTGSSGAGVITGTLVNQIVIVSGNNANATPLYMFGSSGTNYLTLAMFANDADAGFWLSIERTVDASGAVTDQGVVVCYGVASASDSEYNNNNTLGLIAGQGPIYRGLNYALAYPASGTNMEKPIGLHSPKSHYTYPAVLGCAVCDKNAVESYYTGSMTVYGGSHTYLHCGPNFDCFDALITDTDTALWLRFE